MIASGYRTWVERQLKAMASRGAPGKELCRRLGALRLSEHASLPESRQHARAVLQVVREFSGEEDSLRWAKKLEEDLRDWDRSISAFLSRSPEDGDADAALDSVLSGHLTLEEAVALVMGAEFHAS